ncbi:hypothetical protein CCP3SC15_580013 [Gammaproteobacteria bacterium]
MALQLVSRWKNGTTSTERIKYHITSPAAPTKQVQIKVNRLLSLVTQVLVGLVGDKVRGELDNMAVPLHRVEAELVLALGSVLRPRRAHSCGVVPDDGRAKHIPSSVRHIRLKENEVVDIAKHVSMSQGLSNSERFMTEYPHDFGPGFEGVIIEVAAAGSPTAIAVLISINTVGWVSEDHINRLGFEGGQEGEGVPVVDLVDISGKGQADEFS